MKSLLEQLPSIVAEGKREAERVMERAESNYRLGLQTRELVIPSRDSNWHDLYRQVHKTSDYSSEYIPNRLIYGDNQLAIAAMLSGNEDVLSARGSVDLIYIDPPYDSKADYRTKIDILGSKIEQLPSTIEQFAYSDMWEGGTASYLSDMVSRIILMRELLSPRGNFVIHLDHHVSHYMKVVLDEIFGRDNFRNHIVYCYSGGGVPQKEMPRKFDDIFWYSKSRNDWIFHTQYRPYSEGTMQRGRTAVKGPNAELRAEGTPINNWWPDVKKITSPTDPEKLYYDTQKSEELLQRIISMFSDKGGIVADFFIGSGTTAAVAEKLGRKWVAADLGKPACMITRKRLIDQDAKPFLYQHIGDYQVEQMRSTMGSKFRIGDLAEIVLGLFGALPLPVEENPNKNMGRLQGSKTLILADSPNKMTGLATLRRAIEIRENLMGGWDKVIILGWNFSPTIGHDIEALGQGDRLEVLVIPPDLLDRLKKKGHKLKADEVRFSSLQYLKLGEVKREQAGESESLSVSIANYVLLSPEALNLDEANREKLQKVINSDPLALIEYWSVDPDYDGEVFRSVWQDYRGNTDNDDDPYRVVTTARLTGLPKKDGKRRVCVRVVDVFGFEAEATVEVA